jgi:hypothetical protein
MINTDEVSEQEQVDGWIWSAATPCESPRPPFTKGGNRDETMANKVPLFLH